MSPRPDPQSSSPPPPWYRQFWPWVLIAIPGTAVVLGIALVLISLHDPDGLVVDDYYKQGLAINRQLERDRKAGRLGVRARVHLDSDAGTVRVELEGELSPRPSLLQLHLLHPTRSRRDVSTTLHPDALGSYSGLVDLSAPAYWHLSVEPADGTWWLRGRVRLPATTSLTLEPAS
jgi:hypothetical protein